MTSLFCTFVCLLAVNSAFGGTTRAPDEVCKNADMYGLIEIGCWGYRECVNGAYVEHLCEEKYVLDKASRQCHLKGTGTTECDKNSDCTGIPDGMYSDLDDLCRSYYRCYGEINIGQFYCAGNLVFHEEIQSCDFRSNVPPPCGTKRPDTTTSLP
ncbi:hypothetical protein BsWGS_07750 [Bradybaena similaris]